MKSLGLKWRHHRAVLTLGELLEWAEPWSLRWLDYQRAMSARTL